MRKQITAATMALLQDNSVPQNVPKISPLARVSNTEGTGSTSACSTISEAERTGAQAPKLSR